MTKQKQVWFFFAKCLQIKTKYHIYLSIQTLYSVLCLKPLWQRLQPQVFLGMMLQACIWGVSPILCRSSKQKTEYLGWWLGCHHFKGWCKVLFGLRMWVCHRPSTPLSTWSSISGKSAPQHRCAWPGMCSAAGGGSRR